MALPNAHSLRHLDLALTFAAELALNPHIYIAFYEYASSHYFLEALNFFIEHYQQLPQWQRVVKESHIVAKFLAKAAPQQINIEGEVHRKAVSGVGKGLARTFYEAQMACAAIIAAEPWPEFKNAPTYVEACSYRPLKAKFISKHFGDLFDADARGASLSLFQTSTRMIDDVVLPNLKCLDDLNTWVLDSVSKDAASTILNALVMDYDVVALRAYFSILHSRPRALFVFFRVLFDESRLNHLLEWNPEDNIFQLISTGKIATLVAKEYFLYRGIEFFSQILGKQLRTIVSSSYPGGELVTVAEECGGVAIEDATTILQALIMQLASLPFELKFLAYMAYKATVDQKNLPSAQAIKASAAVLLIEALCSALDEPRLFVSDLGPPGVESRKILNLIQILLRSILDKSFLAKKQALQSLAEKMPNFQKQLISAIENHIVNPLKDASYPLLAAQQVSRASSVAVGCLLISVAQPLVERLQSSSAGASGFLMKYCSHLLYLASIMLTLRFLIKNSAITDPNRNSQLLSSILSGRKSSSPSPPKATKTPSTTSEETLIDTLQASSPTLRAVGVVDKSILLSDQSDSSREFRETAYRPGKREGYDTAIVVGGTIAGVLTAKELTKDDFEFYPGYSDHILSPNSDGLKKLLQEYKVPFTTLLQDTNIRFIRSQIHTLSREKIVLENVTIAYDYMVYAMDYIYPTVDLGPLGASLDLNRGREQILDIPRVAIYGSGVRAVELAADLVTLFKPPKRVTIVASESRLIDGISYATGYHILNTQANHSPEADEVIRDFLEEHDVVVELNEDLAIEMPTSNKDDSSNPKEKSSSHRSTRSNKLESPSGKRRHRLSVQKGALHVRQPTDNAELGGHSLTLTYSRRKIVVDKLFNLRASPATKDLNAHFAEFLNTEGYVQVNQYLQMASKVNQTVLTNCFVVGFTQKYPGIQESKTEMMPYVRHAEYVAEAISLLKLRTKLKPYKALEIEKRRMVNLGKNDALAMAHNAVLARGSEAKNLRERSIHYIWKRLIETEKSSSSSGGFSLVFKAKTVDGKSTKKKVWTLLKETHLKQGNCIHVLANTMSGRAVSRILLEQGYFPVILIDDIYRQKFFSDFTNVEFRTFSWSSPSSILEALRGGDVLYYNIETGITQKQHAQCLNEALKYCSYRLVVSCLMGSSEIDDEARKKDLVVQEQDEIIQSLEHLGKEVKFTVVSLLAAKAMEIFSYWFGEDIRKYGSIILPPSGCWGLAAINDIAECAVEVITNPKKFPNIERISITAGNFHLKDLVLVISELIGQPITVYEATNEQEYVAYLVRSGFSEAFANFVAPQSFGIPSTPTTVRKMDNIQRLLRRPPQSFREWAQANVHLFL